MTAAGIAISHPDRMVYPKLHRSKLDVAEYYERIAPLLLPHAAGRPLSLVRCPEGSNHPCFFQKHWVGKLPETLGTVSIKHSQGEKHDYVVIHDVAGLVTLAQWGVVELHLWGARANDPERPDRIVFDLDPGPEVPWSNVRDCARTLRTFLRELGLESWVKTTGGKGLHVVAPIARRNTWEEVHDFSRGVAVQMTAKAPDRYIATASKAARRGLIYIDWLRNSRGATWIAPWSLRARPMAGISAPFDWKGLGRLNGGEAVTLQNLKEIPTVDPWGSLPTSRQRLLRKSIKLVVAGP